jgi:hypothetical protein
VSTVRNDSYAGDALAVDYREPPAHVIRSFLAPGPARDCRRGFTCYADVTLDSRGLPALRDHITGEGRPAFPPAVPHGAGSRPGKPGKEKNRK